MTSSNPSSNPSTGTSFRNFSLARRGNRMKFVPANSNEFVLKASPDSTTAISLTWNEPEVKPDTYRIERSTDGISFSTVTSAGADIFSYTDTGRTESTEYYYRIVPVLDGADQPASNVASTWTVPSTPTGLTATAAGQTQINLAWTDVSTGNTAQSIQRRSPAGSGSYSFIASVGATATSYSDTGLTLATQYEYQVAATNPATQSAWSTAANATTAGAGPPSPSWSLDFSTGEPWANGTNYTFSSTASTTRTYVASSGYVAPSVANLCLQSEDFTTTWTNTNTTEPTTNNTAPDGTATADEIKEAAATSASYSIQQSVSVTTGVTYTFSVYAKAGTATVLQLTAGSTQFGVNEWANFDLSAGVLGSVGSAVTGSDATIENIGSGWYRCKLTMACTATGTSSMIAAFTDNSTTAGRLATYTVTGGNEDSLYLWGAQLVTGSAALPYSATTTSTNGIPRLTHNSSGSRLGLLVEEQRANLILRSEEFNQAGGWPTLFGVSIGANVTTAPDNTSTADELIEDSATSRHNVATSSRTVSQSLPYTASCYVKANNRSYCAVTLVGTGGTGARFCQVFNLTGSGSLGSTDTFNSPTGTGGTITAVGNGWFRVTATMDSQTNTSMQVVVSASNSATPTFASNAPSYLGAGNSAIYVWGAQLEQGSAATSYIPTTTATVTRSADIASVGTSNITGFANNSTLLVEYYRPATNGMVTATNESFNIMGDTGFIGVRSVNTATQSDVAWGAGWTESGANGNLTGTVNATLQKFAYTITSGGTILKSCMNGSMLTTTKTGDNPNMTLPDKLFLGQEEGGTLYSNVIIRKVAFYNSVLSDADMQTITT